MHLWLITFLKFPEILISQSHWEERTVLHFQKEGYFFSGFYYFYFFLFSWLLAFGFWILAFGFWLVVFFGCLASGLLAFGFWLFGSWLLAFIAQALRQRRFIDLIGTKIVGR